MWSGHVPGGVPPATVPHLEPPPPPPWWTGPAPSTPPSSASLTPAGPPPHWAGPAPSTPPGLLLGMVPQTPGPRGPTRDSGHASSTSINFDVNEPSLGWAVAYPANSGIRPGPMTPNTPLSHGLIGFGPGATWEGSLRPQLAMRPQPVVPGLYSIPPPPPVPRPWNDWGFDHTRMDGTPLRRWPPRTPFSLPVGYIPTTPGSPHCLTPEPASEPEEKPPEGMVGSVVGECVICMDRSATHLVVPCGHQCLCATCARGAGLTVGRPIVGGNHTCPACRGPVQQLVRVFVPIPKAEESTKAGPGQCATKEPASKEGLCGSTISESDANRSYSDAHGASGSASSSTSNNSTIVNDSGASSSSGSSSSSSSAAVSSGIERQRNTKQASSEGAEPLAKLMEMGFEESAAQAALQSTNGDLSLTVAILCANPNSPPERPPFIRPTPLGDESHYTDHNHRITLSDSDEDIPVETLRNRGKRRHRETDEFGRKRRRTSRMSTSPTRACGHEATNSASSHTPSRSHADAGHEAFAHHEESIQNCSSCGRPQYAYEAHDYCPGCWEDWRREDEWQRGGTH